MDTVVCGTPGTAHAMGKRVSEGKMRQIVLFHFLFGRQRRIEQLSKSTDSCFLMLFCDVAYCNILNMTGWWKLGTYSCKMLIRLRYLN